MKARAEELSTEQWGDVFRQAAELGILQVDLTGGEPLARSDLSDLVVAARECKLYVNLITSGIGMSDERLQALFAAGLDHIQLSFQDVEQATADEIAGTRAHERKLALARRIRKSNVAFTINVVVHRRNLNRLQQMIALAEELQADKLEIANVQYYGWGMENRATLLPTMQQLQESLETVNVAQERLKGRMRIDFVVPDYYGKYPKACMGGWGRKLMLINPAGDAMPCHAAGIIPGIRFDNVRENPLQVIWEESDSFKRFRGEEWMPEPCRSCDRRGQDFGGCRCQAFLLAGNAAATDPTCSLAPQHDVVATVLREVNANGAEPVIEEQRKTEWVYRPNPV
jgi:pyrroloquinoline quinone biosynthesis protein E